jgi:hypothetical protein
MQAESLQQALNVAMREAEKKRGKAPHDMKKGGFDLLNDDKMMGGAAELVRSGGLGPLGKKGGKGNNNNNKNNKGKKGWRPFSKGLWNNVSKGLWNNVEMQTVLLCKYVNNNFLCKK